MTTRKYQPGDETSINQLFYKVFHKTRNHTSWEWKFTHHAGRVVMVNEKEGNIDGHAGIITLKGQVNGKQSLLGGTC